MTPFLPKEFVTDLKTKQELAHFLFCLTNIYEAFTLCTTSWLMKKCKTLYLASGGLQFSTSEKLNSMWQVNWWYQYMGLSSSEKRDSALDFKVGGSVIMLSSPSSSSPTLWEPNKAKNCDNSFGLQCHPMRQLPLFLFMDRRILFPRLRT